MRLHDERDANHWDGKFSRLHFGFWQLMKVLINLFLIGVGLAFPSAVGVTWIAAHAFQRAKQGKPKGYWKQRFLLTLEEFGLMPPLYVRRSGYWSVGRSKK